MNHADAAVILQLLDSNTSALDDIRAHLEVLVVDVQLDAKLRRFVVERAQGLSPTARSRLTYMEHIVLLEKSPTLTLEQLLDVELMPLALEQLMLNPGLTLEDAVYKIQP